MTKTQATLEEKRDAAEHREREALRALLRAANAIIWRDKSAALTDDAEGVGHLKAAAKKHTNAAHQTSRCAKHLRDAGGEV